MIHLLQMVSDLSELRDLSPTGLSCTGSAQTVTFAKPAHRFPDSNSSGLVVVQVGKGFGVGAGLDDVQELFCNLTSEMVIV